MNKWGSVNLNGDLSELLSEAVATGCLRSNAHEQDCVHIAGGCSGNVTV